MQNLKQVNLDIETGDHQIEKSLWDIIHVSDNHMIKRIVSRLGGEQIQKSRGVLYNSRYRHMYARNYEQEENFNAGNSDLAEVDTS